MTEQKPISPRDLYRALTDILDEQSDLISMADRKARFGVLILGGFNALLILAIPFLYKFLQGLPAGTQMIIGGTALAYIIAALYFFILAIDSIRPRTNSPNGGQMPAPAGFRFYKNIISYGSAEYGQLLKNLDWEELYSEIAFQIWVTAGVVSKKYEALDRLFRGMRILTVWAGVMILCSFLYLLARRLM